MTWRVSELISEAKKAATAGQYGKATSLVQEALKLDPGNREASELLRTLPQIPLDVEWVAEASTQHDGKKRTYQWKGLIYLRWSGLSRQKLGSFKVDCLPVHGGCNAAEGVARSGGAAAMPSYPTIAEGLRPSQ